MLGDKWMTKKADKVLFVSTSHEVVQGLPLTSGVYVCVRCTKRGTIKKLFKDECTPHLEASTSGWHHNWKYSKMYLRYDYAGRLR